MSIDRILFDYATEVGEQTIAMLPAVDTLGKVIEALSGEARTGEDDVLIFILGAIHRCLTDTGEHLDGVVSRMHGE